VNVRDVGAVNRQARFVHVAGRLHAVARGRLFGFTSSHQVHARQHDGGVHTAAIGRES
jgi:hypothetical protein